MEFKQSVIESLNYYVYCLVDPRNDKIFYMGKGKGNRVFNHAADALKSSVESDKLETIREIMNSGQNVKYYIIRHGLTEDESKLVESVLINVFTYGPFNLESVLTNIQAGYHQWDRGIMTAQEINSLYDCDALSPIPGERLMCININNTYNRPERDQFGTRENIYEATRKYWKVNGARAARAEYVLATYRGIVRAVFKPTKWFKSDIVFDKGARWEFEGYEVKDSPYLNTSVVGFINHGNQNPIRYINM